MPPKLCPTFHLEITSVNIDNAPNVACNSIYSKMADFDDRLTLLTDRMAVSPATVLEALCSSAHNSAVSFGPSSWPALGADAMGGQANWVLEHEDPQTKQVHEFTALDTPLLGARNALVASGNENKKGECGV